MNGPTVLVLVLDAVGTPTLEHYLDHLIRSGGSINLPNLSRLGLGTLVRQKYRRFFNPTRPTAYATTVNQASATADSVIGHREMMGIVDRRTYELFPDGFPPGYIAELERRIGRKTMFNRMGGGVEVIEQCAEEHRRTGHPIVYASKCDPLIQIAMDEVVVPVPEQHRIADIALELALEMGIPMTRAIARAFVTRDGGYTRTANRHDAVLDIGGSTLVDVLGQRGVFTVAVGKAGDLVNVSYDKQYHLTSISELDPALGLRFVHPKGKDTNPFNVQGMVNALSEASTAHRPRGTFVFANLADTDALYGHTRDVPGALASIEEFDRTLPIIENKMWEGDLLVITADHGMKDRGDYGYHSREPLPFLAERFGYGHDIGSLWVGTGDGLTKVGMMVAQMFGCAREFEEGIIHVPA